MYQDQAHKNNALRSLLDDLRRHSKVPQDPGHVDYERDLGRSKTSADAAERLAAILNTPVAEPEVRALIEPTPDNLELTFAPQDMCVTVVVPAGVLGKDMPRALYMGPDEQVPIETLTPFHKLIVGAMLDHAREQLDS